MDAAKIQAKINFGGGKAAQYLGLDFERYRPTTAFDPLAMINFEGRLKARIDPSPNYKAMKPNGYDSPLWYGLYDASSTLPFDYLVLPNSGETYFIAAQQSLVPNILVRCNARLTFYRPGGVAPVEIVDAEDDDGSGVDTSHFNVANRDNSGQGALLARDWPASMMSGTKGEKDASNVPEATRNPWFDCLIPNIPGVVLQTGDRIEDDLGNKFKISLPVRDLGWHFTAEQVEVR